MTLAPIFLEGVPAGKLLAAFAAADGDEIASGKFASPESSAALAANAFGWFLDRPALLPPLPGLDDLDWPAVRVDVERRMRFPWRGGRSPNLDAAVETRRHLIAVESKRFEPFRDAKQVHFSAAYDRPVWGEAMAPFETMRDALRAGALRYVHLDAAQLVKHAFGLVSEARRIGKPPILYYLFAEPAALRGTPLAPDALERHRREIAHFAAAVAGAEVRFAACSYREWLAVKMEEAPRDHARRLLETFDP